MCNAEMHRAFFDLGRLSARPFVVNQDLLREIAWIMSRVVKADIVAAAVCEHGLGDGVSQCQMIGPEAEHEADSCVEASAWDFDDRSVLRELSARQRGLVVRRSDLIDDETFRGTRLFREFHEPRGLGDQALCLFTRADGAELLLSLHNRSESGPIPDGALASLRDLAPVLAGAWAAKWRAEPAWLVALTPQGRTVLEMVLLGLDDEQISQRTGLTYHSVRAHLKRLFRDAGVRSRLHLMQACREGAPRQAALISHVRAMNPKNGIVCVA